MGDKEKRGNGIVVIFALLLLTLLITISSADVTELNVNPEVVIEGEDVLNISGRASPNEAIWIDSSFVISLPVLDGNYSREFTGIHFPDGEKAFSVTAENIKDIRIALSPVFLLTVSYPLEGPKNATNGIATISISFPLTWGNITINLCSSRPRNVTVYGTAADDAKNVTLSVDMSIKVIADSNGDFKLDINTEGVPLGEFLISTDEIEKTVVVVSTKPTSVFDTGSPENPYPSMPGIHNGTITPNQTITVSKLYTYPCPDTMGHTERVKIWNETKVIVDANWTGYAGDWHNITFDAITLEAGETYNYTLRTGSYPQIIHERTADVSGGTITCTQFTDADGTVYYDWIPAIILFNNLNSAPFWGTHITQVPPQDPSPSLEPR